MEICDMSKIGLEDGDWSFKVAKGGYGVGS